MSGVLEGADVFFESVMFSRRECPCEEAFADVVDGLRGRVAHVFCVESVVA